MFYSNFLRGKKQAYGRKKRHYIYHRAKNKLFKFITIMIDSEYIRIHFKFKQDNMRKIVEKEPLSIMVKTKPINAPCEIP